MARVREQAIELAENLRTDPRREERLKEQKCVACFYALPRFAGQAFTSVPCADCGTVLTFSSTHTHALCQACASKHSLCVECMSDIDLNQNRAQWPAGKVTAKSTR
jgi:hypothetical protein